MTFPYNKYGNKKIEYGNQKFDSKKEASFARQLDLLKNAHNPENKVLSYERQVKFLLQPSFVDSQGNTHQKIEYWADFVVKYEDGREEVIDVKAAKNFTTDVYKIKKKLLLFKYPDINFKEEY
ncbi:MAG: DUF1064 domain-containing protein [Candidatus Gracilibacteria bacterium]|nr:DUF1064 domain-containing protein [Candidatus Gracilibacteria bacterium]